jgi:hypothetical protein
MWALLGKLGIPLDHTHSGDSFQFGPREQNRPTLAVFAVPES